MPGNLLHPAKTAWHWRAESSQIGGKRHYQNQAADGLGKTSFLAHLVKERGYLHHFIRRASGPQDMLDGAKSLGAQLIRVWDLGLYLDEAALKTVAARRDFLEQLLHESAKRRDALCWT